MVNHQEKTVNRFGIIQLSDLQFGENHRFNNPSDFVSKLQDDIKEISSEYEVRPLYIVLSGDITEKAQQSEFQEAVYILEGFSDNLKIDRMKILSVPGNHDVNWDFADNSQKVGDDQLKFHPYNSFVLNITNSKDGPTKDCYPRIKDRLNLGLDSSLDLEFLLLNSCEKEERLHHEGYVCPKKLQKTLQTPKEGERLKIAILHHPLYPSTTEKDSVIENASDIESILACHKYNIVLTGHVHKGSINAKINDSEHQIIIASCGSTGVNKQKRDDGIQNQYCIHVIDLDKNKFESIWRAYNPSIQTKCGLGGWTQDNSFKINPTKFSLPTIECKPSIVSEIKKIPSLKRKRSVSPKIKTRLANNKSATELAIANLLGAWNEKT
jgi:predicted phosphodiesterase